MIRLFGAIASDRTDLSLHHFSRAQVSWAIQNGLGPLMFRAIQNGDNDSGSYAWRTLKAADLTVRILASVQLEAMGEIIDACRGHVPKLTLLKGVSIADEFYPEAHLRLMRDLDFLVPGDSVPAVEAILRKQGYRQRSEASADAFDAYHHTMPFYNEEKDVWIEIHRGLFSGIPRAATKKVFRLRNVLTELRPSTFQGKEVFRLSNELQLVYIACHWAQAFKLVGGAVAMVDAIHLLKRAGDTLCWARILDWVAGCVAATYLYLLLFYLDHYRLVRIAPDILQQLLHSRPSRGKLGVKAAQAIVKRYFIEGKDFSWILKPGRLDIAWQLLTLPNPFRRELILRKLKLCSRGLLA